MKKILNLVTLCDHQFIFDNANNSLTSVNTFFTDDEFCHVKGDKHEPIYRATRNHPVEFIQKNIFGSMQQMELKVISAGHDLFFVPINWRTKDFIDKLQTLAKTEREEYEKHCHAWA